MKVVLFLGCSALLFAATTLHAGTVTALDGSANWTTYGTNANGTTGITSAQPRSGNGSLQMTTADGSDKSSALFGAPRWLGPDTNPAAPALGTLGDLLSGSISFDYYRDGSSAVAAHLAPAFELQVRNTSDGSSASLKWEPVYNGVGTVTEDGWVSTGNIAGDNFWMWNGSAIEEYDVTLAEWANGDTFGSSTVLSANSVVVGFAIQAGSGWNGGAFLGYVDNVAVTFGNGGNAYMANFEVVPTPAAAGGGLAMMALIGLRRKRRAAA